MARYPRPDPDERRIDGLTAEEMCERLLPQIRQQAAQLLARQGPRPLLTLDDLVANGVLGLLQAFARFEEDQAVSFVSFAHRRITGQMIDAIVEVEGSTRNQRRTARAHQGAEDAFTRRAGRPPGDQELRAELGLSWDQYWQQKGARDRSPSFVEELAEGCVAVEPEALRVLLAGEARGALRSAISGLPDRQRTALLLYYGRGCSLAECGVLLQVTPSRVSQILTEARARLRRVLDPSSLQDLAQDWRVPQGAA